MTAGSEEIYRLSISGKKSKRERPTDRWCEWKREGASLSVKSKKRGKKDYNGRGKKTGGQGETGEKKTETVNSALEIKKGGGKTLDIEQVKKGKKKGGKREKANLSYDSR